jgi:hypothetical protein
LAERLYIALQPVAERVLSILSYVNRRW